MPVWQNIISVYGLTMLRSSLRVIKPCYRINMTCIRIEVHFQSFIDSSYSQMFQLLNPSGGYFPHLREVRLCFFAVSTMNWTWLQETKRLSQDLRTALQGTEVKVVEEDAYIHWPDYNQR